MIQLKLDESRLLDESRVHELMLDIEELAQIEGYRNFAKFGDETNITPETQKLIESKADDNDVVKHDGSVALTDNWITGYKITAAQIASSIAIGTAPLEVVSTTVVTNLNADLLDGVHAGGLEPTVTKGNLTAGSNKVTIGGTGTSAVIGTGVSVDVAQSNLDHGSIGGLSDDDHSQYLRADATRVLSADWDIGDTRMIQADKIRARDGAGLALYEDGGTGLFIRDGGCIGAGLIAPFSRLTVDNYNYKLGLSFGSYPHGSSRRWWLGNDTQVFGDFAIMTESVKDSEAPDVTRFYIRNNGNVTINGGLAVGENVDPGDNNLKVVGNVEIDGDLNHDGSNVGFYGTAPVAKPTVTGSKGGNAALASLITALAGLGLIVDNTT